MVNNQINLTIYSGESPPPANCPDDERVIAGGRLYTLGQLESIFQQGTARAITWAACDAYVLTQYEYIEAAHKEMPIEYYVKFGIARTGTLLLIISIH